MCNFNKLFRIIDCYCRYNLTDQHFVISHIMHTHENPLLYLYRENDTPPEICTPPSKTDYLPYESTDRKDFASSRSLMEILIKRPDLKKYFSVRQQPSSLQKDRAELDGSRLTDTGPIHGHYEYKVKDRYMVKT